MPDGKTAWVEVKNETGKPTRLQTYHLTQLENLNHITAVVYSTEDVDELMERLK